MSSPLTKRGMTPKYHSKPWQAECRHGGRWEGMACLEYRQKEEKGIPLKINGYDRKVAALSDPPCHVQHRGANVL